MSALHLRALVRDRGVDVEFSVATGEVLAVLGPNGAGKSTVLHVIAGLVQPDSGVVRLGDRVLTDTAAGINVATHDRRVGLLLQNPLLFPHLNVADNVAFGPQSRHRALPMLGIGRGRRIKPALGWLSKVEASQLAGRRPRQLSGGQAQRVAIARALAAEPNALLLDEPLAGLDVAAAAAIRTLLRDVVTGSGYAAVVVTHDLLDVFALADRVLVLESGTISEIGPVTEVLAAPRSHFGARIAGVNLVSGTIDTDGALRTRAGVHWHGTSELGRDLGSQFRPGQDAVAVFLPTAVAVHLNQPHGSPRNAVEVTVAELHTRGGTVLVRGQDQPDGAPGLAATITIEAASELRLTPGAQVWFSIKAHEVALHPAQHHQQPR
ncbi:sulfate/molybdate ABC transporter ATP-binding protein [Mycobacterium basiliense]|uniref:sulfate/molybdate ABC transporter ATP-binding protein n=1 Tax=Mycobacterium basiliense TaxID=2094119 RepID=UPI00130159A3|nr:sulfate/molybdate ABC transporter ATP-binding protein [Mycobacterium basiliense]